MLTRNDFPSDFIWGTATASYQIEGATSADGRLPSIWDTFSKVPGAVVGGHTGDIADDHYHRFREDVALMADLGVDAYRFSLAWPRIQPSGSGPVNQAGLDFYRRLSEALREKGITPWVTLYHWDLPQPLEDRGGWLERDTAYRFAEYTAHAVRGLGDTVSDWITLNEPWCSAFLGYGSGHHAPGRHEGSRSAHAAHHLLLGHGLAMQEIRSALPEAQAGITLNLYSVRPASDSPEDADAARRIDGLSNRLFLDPVLRGFYPEDVLDDLGETRWFAENAPQSDLDLISAPSDFLGINFYSRHTVSASAAVSAEVSTDAAGVAASVEAPSAYPGSEDVVFVGSGAARTLMGWEIHPDAMLDVLDMSHERAPELPLYITENGSAWEDSVGPDGEIDDIERTQYLADHVQACHDAVARGLPLRGYFAWTLMDNFEWSWGYTRRFGLVHVDYETLERRPKRSGLWFAGFLGGPLATPDGTGVTVSQM
ncbi:glycoside hydrolase family 1 protein [Microbacterium kunmingense]|uniref:glycoside hydrolase family 1 protein n=1 Tax=Microbacterium kunmingense TaxID=2915939 RepID=UPI0020042877|nr:beta-glucosidase [Microbacterium kunmingense]